MIKETRTATLNLTSNDENKMILEGYAIVFNEETLIGDAKRGFREMIMPSALINTSMKDVPLKYNHMDNFLVIARTKNGSLMLEVDDKGLKIRAELLDTQTNKDIYKMVQNGLLDKMSFAFTVNAQEWDRSGDVPLRKITSIERLYDVSIVDLPAYEGTSIYSRSLDFVESELRLDFVESELRAMDLAKENEKKELIRRRINLKLKIGGK